MPIYKLQGPDGKVYKIEGPEGATAEQLAAVITGGQAGPSKEERVAATRAQMEQEYAPTVGMSGLDKFVAGYGKAGADIARGLGQFVPGLVSREDVAESRKLDKSLMDAGAGAVGNLAGNVAAFAPTAFIPGANTVTGAALIGAASGLIAPSTSTGETLKNVGVGGATGAAIPALITALKTGKGLIEPLYQGGRDKIVGRALTDASATDPQALAQALRAGRPATPGVQYGAAEAARNPSLAALQRTASQTTPAVMNESAARATANNEALSNALKEAAGTEGKRAFFDANRKAAAQELYEKAFSVPIEPENLSPAMRGEVTKLMGMPAVQDALKQSRTNAANYGMSLESTEGSIAGLHQAKLAMDDQISKLMGGSAAEVNKASAIRAARDRLVTFMEKMSPDYEAARVTYRDLSKPITEMDVVQKIADKATNPMTGALYPQQYARVLSDETAKSVSGMANATLENTLSPETLSALNGIKTDLGAQQFAQTAGKGVGSDTVQKLAYSNLLNQAGVPSLVRNLGPAGVVGNLAQRAGQVVYKDANEKLAEQLARALLNPEEAANLVTGAMVNPQLAALANGLRRSGTVAGASAPALVQANQQ